MTKSEMSVDEDGMTRGRHRRCIAFGCRHLELQEALTAAHVRGREEELGALLDYAERNDGEWVTWDDIKSFIRARLSHNKDKDK